MRKNPIGLVTLERLLRVPLFLKILLANVLLVLIVAVASTAFAVPRLNAVSWQAAFGDFLLIGVIGVIVTLPVFALLLHFALLPLQELARVAQRVEMGELSARAPLSPLSDPKLERLTGILNRLLDRVVADRERLRELAERAFKAQESERARIARELHEEMAQTLSALIIRLGVARRTSERAAQEDLLDELRQGLAEITDRIGEFARALQPPALSDLGVARAIESYARRLGAEMGVRVTVEAQDIGGLLTAEAEIALYRILQEALSNVVRHSGAAMANVRLTSSDSSVEATVVDNGRGFVADRDDPDDSRLGLLGMKERAVYFGGSTTIESAPGSGTRVHVQLPVARRGVAWADVGESPYVVTAA